MINYLSTCIVLVCSLLGAFVPSVFADAMAQPARFMRANRVTAGVASAARSLDITVASNVPSPATFRPQSITVENENTAVGDDAYISIDAATATATDGTNSQMIRIRAGKTLSFDVRASQISFIRVTNDVVLNIIAIY